MSEVFWQGFVAGLIGYATVVVVYGVSNLVAGRTPFYTAALLGSVLVAPEQGAASG